MSTPTPLSVDEWAALEAKRLLRTQTMTVADVCLAAARRAPGIRAAAEAIHALLLLGDADISSTIPVEVAEAAKAQACASSDVDRVARVRNWLKRSPYELKKAKTALAAFAVAAPVAHLASQDTGVQDDEEFTQRKLLVEVCKAAVNSARHTACTTVTRRFNYPLQVSRRPQVQARRRKRARF
jgi:hypothetical protein